MINNIKELIDDCLNGLKPKSVLDLGIGRGRCSARFIKINSEITGVDVKEQEIPKEIKFIKEKILDYKIDKNYDLIITSLVLHFFKKEESEKLIKNIKTHTNEKGYNFILCMSDKDELSKDNTNKFYPKLKYLKEIYSNWKIIRKGKYETPLEEHDNLKPHKHNLIYFLVQKI